MQYLRYGCWVILVAIAFTLPADAGCTKPACFAETKWHEGFTAVTIDSPAASVQHQMAIDLIRASGGYVALHSNHVLLGWVPPEADHLLIGRYTMGSIHRGPGTLSKARPPQGRQIGKQRSDDALVEFFESVVSGKLASLIDQGVDMVGPPLSGDALDNPETMRKLSAAPRTVLLSPLGGGKFRSIHTENTDGPPWTNDSMRGEVCVNAFEIESDGSIDPDHFSWTTTQFSQVTTQIMNSVTWWANRAQEHGVFVSFYFGVWEPYNSNALTGYEPLAHVSTDDHKWVNDILKKQTAGFYGGRAGGWGAASDDDVASIFAMAEQYNANYNQLNGCNYGFMIFVAADGDTFAGFPYNGATQSRSFSYYGGPWMQMTYNNMGWGISNFHKVMWHETGHTFWACDEYYDAPSNTGCFTCNNCRNYGPRVTVSNANCANPAAGGPCQTHQACIMETLEAADTNSLCNITQQQIGW